MSKLLTYWFFVPMLAGVTEEDINQKTRRKTCLNEVITNIEGKLAKKGIRGLWSKELNCVIARFSLGKEWSDFNTSEN